MNVAIIGGGAAGFFAALSVKEHHPSAQVSIFEKSKRFLSKVKVSGGGRCNVTNAEPSVKQLAEAYPRGSRLMKKLLGVFNNKDMMTWLENKGVPLHIQEDLHVFPRSQDSQSIIDCFMQEAKKEQINLFTSMGVDALQITEDKIQLQFGKELQPQSFDKVIVCTGGSPKRRGLQWLEDLGHRIEDPVPSLFTFNMPDEDITELMGVVVNPALVTIQGHKLKSSGPLLITHWGMSGPAVLLTSAFGARLLAEENYTCTASINWVMESNHELVKNELAQIIKQHPKKFIASYRPYQLPDRLWKYLLKRHELAENKPWNELGKKGIHKLINLLTNDTYKVSGKTTFKDEFVTCGGISLESINSKTLESKIVPGLYFAGEVLDIDAITGGYNFQAAWTTAYVAGKLG